MRSLNVLRHELRSLRKFTIIWTVSLTAVTSLYLEIFPLFAKDVTASKKLIASMPPAVRAAFGISLQSFFTIFGFLGYLLTIVGLAAAVQAMILGVGSLSKEDTGKTADFLLTKPVSRNQVITAKLIAAAISLVVTNCVLVLTTFAVAKSVSTEAFSSRTFALIICTLFLIQVMFLAIGAILSVLLPKVKSVVAVALPTVFAFFIIGTMGAIIGNDNVRYLSPFKFYDVSYIINNGKYELKFIALEVVLCILAITATYVLYNRKDIRAAS